MSSYNFKSVFPKKITNSSLALVLIIITSLSVGLALSQRDIEVIDSAYIPLVEYSSSLIKLNSEVYHIAESLRISDGKDFDDKKAKFHRMRSILNSVILSMTEIMTPMNKSFISRQKIEIEENALLKNIKTISDKDFSKYNANLFSFSELATERVEEILESRDTFVEKLIFRNRIVFGISSAAFILWLYIFICLIRIIKRNMREKNSLMVDLHHAKEDIEGLVRVISHDLATPLSVIFAYTGLNLQDADSPTNRKKMNAIKVCSKNIAEILDHVKNMQAVKDGKLEIKLEETNVSQVLDELRFIFKEKLEAKNISLLISDTSDKSLAIYVDRSSFKNQVLANIISNSIKFTEHNSSIDISITEDKQNKSIRLELRDHGIGMPKSISENIFGTNVKTSRPGLEGEKGTGFGMPILKVYMDKYNAKIEVDSRCIEEFDTDTGTIFTLIFPSVR